MPGMTASAIIYVEEKTNTLLLSGKAVRFTPDQAYLKKMFEKMKTSGSMPKMQAGVPTGANGMTQTMPAGQTPQGVSSQAAVLSTMNNDPATKNDMGKR